MEGFSCLKWVFNIKWVWGRFSSHDEGPALTARFTGGQVNESETVHVVCNKSLKLRDG